MALESLILGFQKTVHVIIFQFVAEEVPLMIQIKEQTLVEHLAEQLLTSQSFLHLNTDLDVDIITKMELDLKSQAILTKQNLVK